MMNEFIRLYSSSPEGVLYPLVINKQYILAVAELVDHKDGNKSIIFLTANDSMEALYSISTADEIWAKLGCETTDEPD